MTTTTPGAPAAPGARDRDPRRFYRHCVTWPADDVADGLSPMVEAATAVTRSTFCRHVDRESREMIEQALGYATHAGAELTMARDWHVSYHRSVLHGQRVYYFRWSAIEYVFTVGGRDPRSGLDTGLASTTLPA